MPTAAYTMGYASSGFAHHRLNDAVAILADLGYGALSLTLDVVHLDPYDADLPRAVDRASPSATRPPRHEGRGRHGAPAFSSIRAGSTVRPRMDDGDGRRAFDALGASASPAISARTASRCGRGHGPEGASKDDAWTRLVAGCADALTHADACGADLAFEPEPGFLVETVAD
jgi:sugar phosphate isomerase/epimerase